MDYIFHNGEDESSAGIFAFPGIPIAFIQLLCSQRYNAFHVGRQAIPTKIFLFISLKYLRPAFQLQMVPQVVHKINQQLTIEK